MTKRHLICCLTLSAMFLGSERFLNAQDNQRFSRPDLKANHTVKNHDKTKFIRLVKDESGKPKSLETSITRYRSDDGKLLVDLIGVVHVGEGEYYRKLNYQFKQYESLLYELVAPESNRVPDRNARKSGGNPIHFLQNSMQRMLGLQSQLKYIDYTKDNFVHADMSPRQMQQKMAERGDTAWSLGMKAFNEMMQKQSQAQRQGAGAIANDLESFEDLFSLINDPVRLKVMMASQFAEGGALEAGLGSSLNQLLITDRNKAAMDVLNSEIEKGQTKIGIFYGAAHMPDFEKRLADLGLKKTRQAWVEAWDLQSKPEKAGAYGLTDMFFELIDSIE